MTVCMSIVVSLSLFPCLSIFVAFPLSPSHFRIIVSCSLSQTRNTTERERERVSTHNESCNNGKDTKLWSCSLIRQSSGLMEGQDYSLS